MSNSEFRVIGHVSFFNEADNILRCLESIIDFCDVIVCIDGAYKRFPHEEPYSTDGSIELIQEFMKTIPASKQFVLREVEEPWDTEVAKRNIFLEYGVPGDWYLIADADMELQANAYGKQKVRSILAKMNTPKHAKILQVGVECVPSPEVVGGYAQCLLRHVPRAKWVMNHFTLYDYDRDLWFGSYFKHHGQAFQMKLQRGIPFRFVHYAANEERQKLKEEYYKEMKYDERYDWWNFVVPDDLLETGAEQRIDSLDWVVEDD
ncbi:MAG: hypothetical protein ACXADF_14490 [Candidatus Thorarchaeota archaeon]|jgi:hypothetical protein